MKWKKLNLQLFADAHEQLQNTTGSSGMSAEMKTFYERRLIDQALLPDPGQQRQDHRVPQV